jgi:hypothetical protein
MEAAVDDRPFVNGVSCIFKQLYVDNCNSV